MVSLVCWGGRAEAAKGRVRDTRLSSPSWQCNRRRIIARPFSMPGLPILFLGLIISFSSAAVLQLSTGTLDFKAVGETSFPSLRVLLAQPSSLGEARAAIEAQSCCSVHSFLPPSAFLVHCPSAACHASAAALVHVTGSAALPPQLKVAC